VSQTHLFLQHCRGDTPNDGTAYGGQQLVQIAEEGGNLAGGAQQLIPDCGKMEQPMMVQNISRLRQKMTLTMVEQ
jgi:hypothetical protein